MDRRDVVGLFGIAAGLSLTRPFVAWADRIRVLPAVEGPEAPRVGVDTPLLRAFLGSTRVGELRAHGGLGVFWLHATRPAVRLPVETLDEARGRGTLVITERGQATVPTLVAENRGKTHVLLLAGEILVGGKQNRVVAEDVLLPPLSGPRNIAVFCVEQGRWAGPTKEFRAPGSLAAPSLRSELAAQPSQDRVWAEVHRYAARAAAPSPTSSYQVVFDKPEVQAHQKEVERTIDHKLARDAQGAAVFVGDRLSGIDLFHDADLFAREWPKLLRAHALETYDRAIVGPPEPRLRGMVTDLLAASTKAPATRRGTAGVGTLFEFRVERLRGAALVAEEQVVHAAML